MSLVIVAGSVRIQPGKMAEAEAACNRVADATRTESGCIEYAFWRSIKGDGVLHVFERWESSEALDAHLKTDHVAAFFARLPELIASPPVVHRYLGATETPL